jgi:hypothetical protein
MAQLRLIKLTSLLSLLTRPVPVRPGFSPDSDNIAVYWGEKARRPGDVPTLTCRR